eukprot:TRINITY_DN28170_c0_g1_i2.p1 TRINITY_DN28170_c0_g1~~TRINITY_DN28170_c0_g1_i2.p1  ORF type:complete len:310 (-),score=71.16 TRINITY_DN28170_c0_g1_i2:36-965(-)
MAKVILHIYDVSTDPSIGEVNKILVAMGTGAFHGGVEVYHKEWSYGYTAQGSGVFCCEPKGCTAHIYRESIVMGETKLNPKEVSDVLAILMAEWKGTDYNLLTKNCVIFCDAFCQKIGVGSVPSWVKNLAGAGATLEKGAKQAQATAILAAAKAGEIDEKYQISSKASEAASVAATQATLLAAQASAKYTELDKQYKFKETAIDAAEKTHAKATLLAMQACTKASELDQQYKIQETALLKANEAWSAIKDFDEKYKVQENVSAAFFAGVAKAGEGLAMAKDAVQQKLSEHRAEGPDAAQGKGGCPCQCQ